MPFQIEPSEKILESKSGEGVRLVDMLGADGKADLNTQPINTIPQWLIYRNVRLHRH